MTGSDTPAITCRNVWQVFGNNADSALKEALSRHETPEAAALELRGKGLIPAVQDASFDVKEGELFVIMGLSGSGKSTLIRCISHLLHATGGEIRIDGENIVEASPKRLIELRRKKLGMVFQHFGLFPHMTVAENVAYPLRVQGVKKKQRLAKAQEVIELVGLGGREKNYPRELSGGQRQRVGIARSLVADCSVWFLDEPFSALDPLIRRQLQDEFLEIQAKLKTTIVFITHDINEALKLADRIAIMRDGKVVQIGTPADIVLRPADDYVREFSKDVAKGRHAHVSSVMLPGEHHVYGADDPGLRQDMTLDAALARCMELYEPVPVRTPEGKLVGVVNPADLAAALQVEQG
ncbi:betaine/proline/choline family ABC transporter ATP-binding protein [Leisingera aquaemixtae]|uniref:quaternary amine ABC transporter ATP-binding protein n=1 Tax=Leisingera aquaemixtae TaxID=1396826 RepID=UPI0021A61C68|nr:betaine/proline/choline family ABC transporter ATP-binding protein [Leisingera aquaemixtae]UWQ23648.1 betaine/proline/choline family ABC transporter ATP-binding protein [Leisingera aquaemixtae]